MKWVWKFKIHSWIMSWFRDRAHNEWISVRNKLDTPQKITDYLHNNGFKWTDTEDKICDNMMRPDQFIKLKRGDCDDFANFTYTILRYHKYKCELWAIFSRTQGHAITVVEIKKNMWGVFSNREIRLAFYNKEMAINWFFGDDTIRRERIK